MTGVTFLVEANLIRVEPDKLVDDECPRLPGLFVETVTPSGLGGRVWEASVDLKPGERLHEGKLDGVFTNQLHWELIDHCGIEDIIQHSLLLSALREIANHYKTFARFERENGPLGRHKARIKDIHKLTAQLLPFLAAEPLLRRLLCPTISARTTQAEVDECKREAERFLGSLSIIGEAAAQLASSEPKLRTWRNESWDGAETGKSAERRFIWERVFKLWRVLGRRAGYTEDGPILRTLRVIHDALEIEPPRGPSVRQAIVDFNKKTRAPAQHHS